MNTLLSVLEHHGGFIEKGGKDLIWAARALATGGGKVDADAHAPVAGGGKAVADDHAIATGGGKALAGAHALAVYDGKAGGNGVITETAVVPKVISDWRNASNMEVEKECKIETKEESHRLDDQVKKNCNVCGQILNSEENLKDHAMLHAKEKGKINSIFEPTGGVIKSENIESKQIVKNKLSYIKRLPCGECGVKTGNLESHKLRKHIEKSHFCDTCGNKFISISILNEHVQTNHACNECGATFKHLKAHKLQKHTEKAHFCDTCGSGFITSLTLTEHIKINHTNEIDATCKECRKKFHSKSALRTHQKAHGDPLAFVCDECGKGFKMKQNLKRHHRLRHSKYTPVICSFEGCNVKLKREGLKRHNLIHTGKRPFECENCEAKFLSRNALGRHTLTHSGEKPFKCSQCDKEFSQNCNLKTHEIKHHN